MTGAQALPGAVPAGIVLQICFERWKGLYMLSIEGIAMAAGVAFRVPAWSVCAVRRWHRCAPTSARVTAPRGLVTIKALLK